MLNVNRKFCCIARSYFQGMAKRRSARTAASKSSKADTEEGPSESKYFKSSEKQKSIIKTPDNEEASAKAPNTKPSDSGDAAPSTSDSSTSSSNGRLGQDFYQKSCVDLSKDLLGKYLVRKLDSGDLLKGMIVETEAYLGGEDKAAHSFNGKRTAKNEAMYMDPGTGYVYHIYGLYTCINISSEGEGAAVLIRGLEPVLGLDVMRKNRGLKRADKGKGLKDKELSNGPSKLTQALSICKALGDQKDLVTYDAIWVEEGQEVDRETVVACARVGIDYAKEWAAKPLRFYIKGNQGVSVRDKTAEKGVKSSETDDKQTGGKGTEKVKKSPSETAAEASGTDEEEAPRNRKRKGGGAERVKSKEPGSVDCNAPNLCVKSSPAQGSQDLCFRSSLSDSPRLGKDYFSQPCLTLAQNLLGKVLVRQLPDGTILSGIIVETEAYLGILDGSCHSYSGKPTAKTAAMFMCPGTVYVYHVYFRYYCFNISASGTGAVVLIRALHPISGLDKMREARGIIRSDKGMKLKDHHLCNGPSKLCMAMRIDQATLNQVDLCTSPLLWLQDGCHVEEHRVVVSTRIGLENQAGEWRKKPWRFYIRGCSSVTVRHRD